MNPDGDPLFHIKQSKNIGSFVFKNIDSQENRNSKIQSIQNTFLNIKFHQKIEKRFLFVCFS